MLGVMALTDDEEAELRAELAALRTPPDDGAPVVVQTTPSPEQIAAAADAQVKVIEAQAAAEEQIIEARSEADAGYIEASTAADIERAVKIGDGADPHEGIGGIISPESDNWYFKTWGKKK